MSSSNWKRILPIVIGWTAIVMTSGLSRAAGPESSPGSTHYRPDPASVQRYAAGYRYPQAGWIVLHIEGEPYERGFQHGRLMAPEISRFIPELARYSSQRAPADGWRALRLLADALFLRRFDAEYREEMKGIADGAAAAGATFDGRPVDLLDIVTINADIETNFLENALEATATGLEGRKFREPAEQGPTPPQESHCSAFAATGPATADGQVVIGHITMWNLFHAYHYNVWLDVKPARGHRVLMQTYPGGIMSGLDYYMSDRGLVVCETTIAQTKFDDGGIPVADRIRRALQYGDSIDDAVRILRQGNNGLYTNEWLLADTRANEIAMFELGTHRDHLWRSSRNEWFGGTPGFYWGCNNAKDLQVRLESVPSTAGRPSNVVFHPSDRDRTWLQLFDRKNKSIDAEFGFLAFTTPPLAASRSLDAKFTTTAMVRELATWAKFGPPLGTTWEPTDAERLKFPGMHPLIANDWTVLRAEPPAGAPSRAVKPVDLARIGPPAHESADESRRLAPAWHGTLLPRSDADTWLAAAFADYERVVAEEKALKARAHNGALDARARERIALSHFVPTSKYLAAVARRGGRDLPLGQIRADLRTDEWYDIAAGKGVLVLAELRAMMGDGPFEAFMDGFGRAHAGSAVDTAAFFQAAEKAHGKPLSNLADAWLGGDTLPRLGAEAQARHRSGRIWSVDSFERQLDKTLIVYGTLAEADVQRQSAARLQRKLAVRWANIDLPIKADSDVSDAVLKDSHILLIGRPSTNRLTARLAGALPVRFGPVSVSVAGETFAHPQTGVVAAGPNPMATDRSVVVFAGLGTEGMWDCVGRFPDRGQATAEVLLMEAGSPMRGIAVPPPSTRDDPLMSATPRRRDDGRAGSGPTR
jgi:Phospholipase B